LVQDTLPAELVYKSSSGTGWTCSESSGKVSCTLAGALGNLSSAEPLTIVASGQPGLTATVTNTETVESPVLDIDRSNNTGVQSTAVALPAPPAQFGCSNVVPVVKGKKGVIQIKLPSSEVRRQWTVTARQHGAKKVAKYSGKRSKTLRLQSCAAGSWKIAYTVKQAGEAKLKCSAAPVKVRK
jgi:hypothetical protein